MERLLDGYRRFRADVWPTERERYRALSEKGQRPETLVIACSDSRVDPQTVFGAAPGELFVVRNVAALIPPYEPDAHYHGTSAALEFGVRVLKVRQVVVLGHAQCGGIQAMVDGAPAEARDFVEPWVRMAKRALSPLPDQVAPADRLPHYETQVLRLSLENLMTYPWIADSVAASRLQLSAFRFDIHSGVIAKLEGEGLVPVS